MRAKLVGLGVLLLIGGALGCFEAVEELNETEAVAEALTRGMRFDGGEVVDGDLPNGIGEGVLILPPGLPTVMSPGDESVMLFDLDAPEEVEDPAEATLFKFAGSKKHIRVTGGSKGKGEGTGWHFEHPFAMDDNLCDGLCNKQHPVKLRMAMKMRNGRMSAEKELNLTLDCRDHGDSSACENTGGSGIAGAEYVTACQNAAGVCANLSDDIGISAEVVECVALYQCVQVFYTGDGLCQGLVEDLVDCMGKADDAIGCDDCSLISDELMNTCPFPSTCLNLPFDGLDASTGPAPVADASMPDPGIDFMFSDSLVQNCAMMCDLSQRLGCTSFSDTCQQDCEGGFAGTVCEKAVVDFQRCAWGMADQTMLACDDMSMPAEGTADCPAEMRALTDCFIANPDILPGGVDAGLPP